MRGDPTRCKRNLPALERRWRPPPSFRTNPSPRKHHAGVPPRHGAFGRTGNSPAPDHRRADHRRCPPAGSEGSAPPPRLKPRASPPARCVSRNPVPSKSSAQAGRPECRRPRRSPSGWQATLPRFRGEFFMKWDPWSSQISTSSPVASRQSAAVPGRPLQGGSAKIPPPAASPKPSSPAAHPGRTATGGTPPAASRSPTAPGPRAARSRR